jgi:HlyD family secretion protein
VPTQTPSLPPAPRVTGAAAGPPPEPPPARPGASAAPPARGLRRRWLRVLGLAVAVAAIVALLRATLFAPAPLAVTVAAVTRGPVEETVTNSRAGTLRARQRAKLSPEVGGRVVELPFRKGQRVPAGAVVLRLDDAVQRAHLAVAERDLATAQAQGRQACLAAEQARRELARYRRLAEQGLLSDDQLDRLDSTAATQGAACEAAGEAVQRARAAIGLARAEVERTVLRAPFDAVVAELATDLGEYVSPSPPGVPLPAVVDLLAPDTLYVSAPMDEVDAARLRPGLPARVTVDPLPDDRLAGEVFRVASYVLDVEQQNRTVEIEVELADRALAATLLPGTSADVEVILELRPDVLRIPTQALIEERRALVVEGGRLVARDLEVGLRNWDFTEVRGGLREGERVVLSLDRDGVEPGAAVVVEEAP